MSILGILIVFSVVILIHEFGHFWVAKKLGIKVEKFSFGFGPKIFSWKRGETEYLICPIIFGGYVKLAGEEGEGKGLPEEYSSKSPGHRALVLVSGGLHNLVAGYFFIILALMLGILLPYDGTKIGDIVKGYPAAISGLQPGDEILSVDGKKTHQWLEVWYLMLTTDKSQKSSERTLNIQIKRDSEIKTFYIKPSLEETGESIFKGKKRYIIGILPKEKFVKYGFFKAVPEGLRFYRDMIGGIEISLKLLITGQIGVQEFSGPVGIAQISGKVIKLGFASFCYFIAFININLGIVNLLPYFVLDGGHIVGVLGERVFRRKPHKKLIEIGNIFGAVSIICFALFVTYHDILRIVEEKVKQGK